MKDVDLRTVERITGNNRRKRLLEKTRQSIVLPDVEHRPGLRRSLHIFI